MDDPEHVRFMREALALADEAARQGEVPVGAVIVRDGAIVGRGANRREVDHDPTAHAELIAMRAASAALGTWRLEGCTVYVTLEPCAMCAGAMVLARVDACVYGCRDPKGGFLGTVGDLSAHPALNHAYRVVPGVLEAECGERLAAFFRELRERKKKERWPSG